MRGHGKLAVLKDDEVRPTRSAHKARQMSGYSRGIFSLTDTSFYVYGKLAAVLNGDEVRRTARGQCGAARSDETPCVAGHRQQESQCSDPQHPDSWKACLIDPRPRCARPPPAPGYNHLARQVDRLERASKPGGWGGLTRPEVMDDMYGRIDPKPRGANARCQQKHLP